MVKKSWSKRRKIVIAFIGIVLLGGFALAFDLYLRLYSPNVNVENAEKDFLYIPTGTTLPQLLNMLVSRKIVNNSETFKWVAERMDLNNNLHPGRYKLKPRMNNYELVKLLRSGIQSPVKLVLKKFRTKEELTSFLSTKLEIDSTVLIEMLNDEVYLRQMNFNPDNIMVLFIPNTYECYWTIKETELMQRMNKEYEKFWTSQRKQKARVMNLSPVQVSILASIVEEETNHNDEKPQIASVYLNRLKKDMPLQADPTVKFSLKNFFLKRIWSKQTENDSPYNTYKYAGLPPGPICTPSIKTIDSVLNAPPTDYLYFCASVDKPGYHAFAATYKEHQMNANKYRKYLNRQGIK